MKWEHRTIAISLPIIVILVVLQTLGIFGALDAGFREWLFNWQTWLAAVTAASLAIVGVALQIGDNRRRNEEALREAEKRWQAEAAAMLTRDTQQRLDVLRQQGHAVIRDMDRIIQRCRDYKGLLSELRATNSTGILSKMRALSWSTDNLDHWAPKFGTLGAIARDLYKVTDAYEPLRREIEVLALGRQTAVNDHEAVNRLFSDPMKALVERALADSKAAKEALRKFLEEELPNEFATPTLLASDLLAALARLESSEQMRRFSNVARVLDSSILGQLSGVSTLETVEKIRTLMERLPALNRQSGLGDTRRDSDGK